MIEPVLRCLALPTTVGSLLLPCQAVAEVTKFTQILSVPGKPHWLLGKVEWRDILIPLISLEALEENSFKLPPLQGLRMAVLQPTKIQENRVFFAILLQGVPKLYTIERGDIELIATSVQPQYMMEAKYQNQLFIIPNLDWLSDII